MNIYAIIVVLKHEADLVFLSWFFFFGGGEAREITWCFEQIHA